MVTLLSFSTQAQQLIKATIAAHSDGLQSIRVPQEFRSKIGNNSNALRLFNQKGEEIPFIVKPAATSTTDFKAWPFERSIYPEDSTEIYVLHNPEKHKKQRIFLKIANTTTAKSYTIEGSNDQQTWFSLVAQGQLNALYSETDTYVTKSISFPLMDYQFIRIILDNKKSAAINIIDIGEIETLASEVHYEKLRNTSWKMEQDTGQKSTRLTLSTEGLSPVDFLKFHISAPNKYLRHAEIYQNVSAGRKKAVSRHVYEYLSLTNSTDDAFAVDIEGQSDFYIQIFNEDNAPLTIDSVSLYQKPIELLAELRNGFSYSLDAATKRKAPNYDLSKVELDLPDSFPQAEITRIEIPISQKEDGKSAYGNIILILGSILGVLVVFYFGSSLLKDMKKQK
jgi:hypothetical protein